MESHRTGSEISTTDGSKIIGFTLSPKPQRCDADINLFIIWINRLHPLLKKFSKTYSYYPEFDESGRLHFHGVCEIYDMIKFKRTNGSLRQYGFVKYEFKLGEKWYKYIKKDLLETLKIFNNVPSDYLPVTQDTLRMVKKDIVKKESNNTWFESNGWIKKQESKTGGSEA